MANTPDERQKLKQALTLIANKYSQWMTDSNNLMSLLGAHQGQFDVLVKFMDEGAFISNYSLSNGAPPKGCQINGFFSKLQKPFEIYINRQKASPSTLVHELLHMLTHPTFNQMVSEKLNEGVTEYFTRKVQGAADPNKYPDFLKPRQSYNSELGSVNNARGFVKNVINPNLAEIRSQPIQIGRHRAPGFTPDPLNGVTTEDFVKRAYFKGEVAMINLLKENAGI